MQLHLEVVEPMELSLPGAKVRGNERSIILMWILPHYNCGLCQSIVPHYNAACVVMTHCGICAVGWSLTWK